MAVDPEKIDSIPNDFQFHEPLDRDSKEIRLLTLAAGHLDSEICCSLTIVSLTAKPIPRYKALSYCWGSLQETKTITLRHRDSRGKQIRQPFAVSANLAGALRHMRRENRSRTLWIDAICINRSDVLERSYQASITRSVYKSAAKTLIWLGEDDGTVDMALELAIAIIRKIDKSNSLDEPDRPKWNAEPSSPERQEISDYLRDLNKPLSLALQPAGLQFGSASWSALARFLSRPWFRRVWAIQEVTVSACSMVYCGDYRFKWTMLELIAAWISRHNILGQTGEEGFRWADNVKRMFMLALPEAITILGPNPLLLLWMIKDFDATDPRDKIFASLPLLFNTDVGQSLPEVLMPDYTKPTEILYRDLVRYTTQAHRNLDSLSMIQPHRASDKLRHNVPGAHDLYACLSIPTTAFASWVPRWEFGFGLGNSEPLALFPGPSEGSRPLYRASGVLPFQAITLKIPTEPNSLLVRGLRLDRITSVSECIWTNFVDIDLPPHLLKGSTAFTGKNPLWRTWNIYRQELLSYTSGEDPMTVLRLLLVANRTRMKRRADEDSMSEADFAAYLQMIGWDMECLPPEFRKRQTERGVVGDARRYSTDLVYSCVARSVFGTSLGYLGLCHVDVQVGDIVCMFFGGKVLYVLREKDIISGGGQTWHLLGEAYMHGQMDGTAFAMKRSLTDPVEVFDLR